MAPLETWKRRVLNKYEPGPLRGMTWQAAWERNNPNLLQTWFRNLTGPKQELTTATTGLVTVTSQADADTLTGRHVTGRVLITASNVYLHDFKVTGDGSGAACVEVSGSRTGILIEDFEIDGNGLLTPLAGLGGSSFARGTFRRGNIHNCLDRVRLFEGSTYQHMYLHTPVVNPAYVSGTTSQHADAVQAVRGAAPIVVSESWLDSSPVGANVTGAVIIKTDSAAITGVSIDRCYLNGGKYTVTVEAGAFGAPTNVAVTDCRFGRSYTDGLWSGAGVDPNTVTRTGNVWADDGTAVPLTWGLLS
jgi:hypothetical protein